MPNVGEPETSLVAGDIAFLSKKEFDSKLRTDEGSVIVVGDLATLTANTGKDMYLTRAKISIVPASQDANVDVAVELKINGVIVETALYKMDGAVVNSHANLFFNYEFKNVGYKVAAGEIIKLEVVTEANGTITGFIQCYEEDTGDDPISA